MSQPKGEAPSGKAQGSSEGNNSSISNLTPQHRQFIELLQYFNNLLLNDLAKGNYCKYVSQQVASNHFIERVISQGEKRSYNLDSGDLVIGKAVIVEAYFKTLRTHKALDRYYTARENRKPL